MKEQQMKDLIETGCIEFIQIQPVIRYFNDVVYERHFRIWVDGNIPSYQKNLLETARGDIREYKSLDSAYRSLINMGVKNRSIDIASPMIGKDIK